MNLTYDPSADILCLTLSDRAPADATEEPSGVIVSYDAQGTPVSVEFLEAAARRLVDPDALSITMRTLTTTEKSAA